MPSLCFIAQNPLASREVQTPAQAAQNPSFNRPPLFYVSRGKFGPKGSQAQTSSVPLISSPRSTVSRYGKGIVENITINIDDQASVATVRFPCEVHDANRGNIVGDEVKIRLAKFEGFGSQVIFRGLIISPNLELGSNADGIAYDCVGFRFLLNSDVVFGRQELQKNGSVKINDFAPTIFNQDGFPNRSKDRKNLGAGLGSTFVFDQDGKDAKLWTVGDVLQYIFVSEAGRKVPDAVNIPDLNYTAPLTFVPKHLELQNEQIATAITRTVRQMGSAYHWWLDDFFSAQGGAQSSFKWFVIGGIDKTVPGTRIEDALATAIGTGGAISGSRDTKRVFTIGKLPEKVDDNPNFNVAEMNISENGSDIVNRLIVIGDFIRVESVFKLTQDWTDAEETDLKLLLPDDYPGIAGDSAPADDAIKFKSAERDATLANVFRQYKLDETEFKEVLDEIEDKLDDVFGAPKNLSGETIKWFDRKNLPPFDRELFTNQEDINEKKKKIRMQVYGYTDFRKRLKDQDEGKETSSILIEDGFLSWSLGRGGSAYIIDPTQPKITFRKIIASKDFIKEGIIFVTAVLKTNVRIFHDTGFVGESRINVTRIIEDERYKRVMRFKSLVPEREVESQKPTSFKVPDKDDAPINIIDYFEDRATIVGSSQTTVNEKKETGYIEKSATAESVRDDLVELRDYANDTLDVLQKIAVETNITLPFPSGSYKPGELIKRVVNSGFKNFKDSTIVQISIDGVGYRTTINTTNKKD